MSDTQQIYDRFRTRDPLLFAALYAGQPAAVEGVTRLLRLTPLTVLARHRDALVEALSALPELHPQLRRCWDREDAVLSARLFTWAEHSRVRLHRAA